LLNENIEIPAGPGQDPAVLNRKDIIDQFHKLYYESGVWQNTSYFGIPVLKCPLDLWIYQEMIVELQPDYIVETGTFYGGSALYMAFTCDVVGKGEIISIDILNNRQRPTHPRIAYLTGSSTDPDILRRVREIVGDGKKVMVILDSDHSRDHVYGELKAFQDIVTIGSYLVIEDSNVNGHPVRPDFGPGPMEAINSFLSENDNFVVDSSREKFMMTLSPNGYLKRVR
jgi:cephalosporin hydroxylase